MRLYLPIVLLMFAFGIAHGQSGGLGGFCTFKSNEVRPGLFFELNKTQYTVQLSPLPFTVIPHDAYNPNHPSVSVYPALWFATGIVGSVLTGGGSQSEWFPNSGWLPDSSILWHAVKYLVRTSYLLNADHHLNLVARDSNRTNNVVPSIFVGLQTDYFIRDKNWIRMAPGAGFQLAVVHPKTSSFPDFAVQVGLDKPFDFGNHVHNIGPVRGFVNAKLYLL